MTKEELLIEAQRKYPIGTKFRDVNSIHEYIVERFDIANYNDWNSNTYIIVHCKDLSRFGKYLYNNGKWAEIIEYPEGYKQTKYYYY